MKWLWRLCRLAVEAVLVGAVSVFTVWYAVTEQMEAVWESLSISPPDVAFDPAEYVSALARQAAPFFSASPRGSSGASGRPPAVSAAPHPGEAQPVWNAVTPPPAPSVSPVAAGTPLPNGAVSPQPPAMERENGEASAVGSSAGGSTPDRTAVAVTERQILELRGRLSDADKRRVFDLLAARLTADEIGRIADMFEDGLTEAELKEVNRIVEKRLSPAEYAELARILAIRADTD